MHTLSKPARLPILLIILITACVDPPEQFPPHMTKDMSELIADMPMDLAVDMVVDMPVLAQDMALILEDMSQPDEGLADMAIIDLCEGISCGVQRRCNPDSGACVACLEDTHCNTGTHCNIETFMCACSEFEIETDEGCKLITGSPCDPVMNRCIEETHCIAIKVGEMSAQSYCLRPKNGTTCAAPWPVRIDLNTATGGGVYCSVDSEKLSPEAVRNLGRSCMSNDACGGLGGECINTQCTYACIDGPGGGGRPNCANNCVDGYCQAF